MKRTCQTIAALMTSIGIITFAYASTTVHIVVADIPGSPLGFSGATLSPLNCHGTIASYPYGAISLTSCEDGNPTPISVVTTNDASAWVTASGGTASFSGGGGSGTMHFQPALSVRVIASDSSFDCSGAMSTPDFTGSLVDDGFANFKGTLTLSSAVSGPTFNVTSTCPNGTALTLDSMFATLSSGTLHDVAYSQ